MFQLSVRISFHHLVLFFWRHGGNWGFFPFLSSFNLLNVHVRYQSNDVKLWFWKLSMPGQCSDHLLKYSCLSRNGFWLVDDDLSIDFCRIVYLWNWDMACKIGCRLFLDPQLNSLAKMWINLFGLTLREVYFFNAKEGRRANAWGVCSESVQDNFEWIQDKRSLYQGWPSIQRSLRQTKS